MIRINLLPQAKKTKAVRAAPAAPGSTQAWAVVYFAAAVVWVAALVGVYMYYDGILTEQRSANAALSTRIEQLRARSAQLEEVQAQIAESQELEDLVAELNRGRHGPTRLMLELSGILSEGGGPTIDPQALEELRRDDPLAGFNRSWDPRRLWLTSFSEEGVEGARNCSITGLGKTNEDVAEFLRRLNLSEIFTHITLEKTESRDDPETGLTFIGFDLICQVEY
jgi:type IV pilus assembly protein PilN